MNARAIEGAQGDSGGGVVVASSQAQGTLPHDVGLMFPI